MLVSRHLTKAFQCATQKSCKVDYIVFLPQKCSFSSTPTSHISTKLTHQIVQSTKSTNKSSIVLEPSRNPIQRVWQAYTSSLNSRPLLTKCSVAGLIFFTSDVVTQTYFRNDKQSTSNNGKTTLATVEEVAFQLDLNRAAGGAVFGVLGASWLHFWWGVLEQFACRYVPAKRSKVANTLFKVSIDQILAAPLYSYSYFFITRICLKNTSNQKEISKRRETNSNESGSEDIIPDLLRAIQSKVNDAHNHASSLVWPTMMKHWKIWPAFHCMNMYHTPLQHRVLVHNVCLVGWSGYLSYLSHGGAAEETSTNVENINSVTLKTYPSIRLG